MARYPSVHTGTGSVPAGLISFGAVGGLAVANGGFFPQSWGPAVVALSWAAVLLLVLDRSPAFPQRGELLLALACAIVGWTALTAWWSESVTSSLLEAERALVVVAAALALLLARDRTWMLRGVVAAAALTAAWNLVAGGAEPVGYANGIGALTAIGVPLALRERATWPALAVLVPALVLSHSRGAWLALGLAAIVGALRRPALVAPAVAVAIALAWVGETRRGEYFPVAVHEARAAPIGGTGAGTWEIWWLERRPAAHEAHDAHSVYLETLGEQGVIGLALLAGLLATPLLTRPRDRLALAAYAAFVIHQALDWDRELPMLTVAGLAVGIALLPDRQAAVGYRRRAALATAALALGGLGVLSGVAQISLARARDAAHAGDFPRAESLTRRAARVEPWSSRPLEVRGEAQLAAGDRRRAAATLRAAIAKDSRRWRLWHDLHEATGSRRAGDEARRLNPLGG
ncbi:MAG TPA: O-antigen ligase family protein [Gaiellaceae bacterium]